MIMQVFVVRDSNCGNGNDDPGKVLGVFTEWLEAQQLVEHEQNKDDDRTIEIEGPFELQL